MAVSKLLLNTSRIQRRYCGGSLKKADSYYKEALQCDSTFLNNTRLNFYDRYCDGIVDCENGEDEKSLPKEEIKLVQEKFFFIIP